MAKWEAIELAWAAGFFDGEGSTSVHTSKGGKTHNSKEWKYPRIHIGQVDQRPLDRFVKAVKVGKVFGPYRHSKNLNAKPRYDYFAQPVDEVIQVIACLWNYLSEPKKEQIKEVIEQWRNGYSVQ